MRRTAPAIAAVSLSLSLALTGCFANPLEQLTEGLVEGGVEQIIQDQTGVDVDFNGTGASLPSSWPADVPTVNGNIVFSAAADNNFTAAITVPNLAAAQQAFSDLANAGFTQTSEVQLGEGAATRSFENGSWLVNVIIAENEDGTGQVQYSITPASP